MWAGKKSWLGSSCTNIAMRPKAHSNGSEKEKRRSLSLWDAKNDAAPGHRAPTDGALRQIPQHMT